MLLIVKCEMCLNQYHNDLFIHICAVDRVYFPFMNR